MLTQTQQTTTLISRDERAANMQADDRRLRLARGRRRSKRLTILMSDGE